MKKLMVAVLMTMGLMCVGCNEASVVEEQPVVEQEVEVEQPVVEQEVGYTEEEVQGGKEFCVNKAIELASTNTIFDKGTDEYVWVMFIRDSFLSGDYEGLVELKESKDFTWTFDVEGGYEVSTFINPNYASVHVDVTVMNPGVNEEVDEETSEESVDPTDIHSYVDCGEVVSHVECDPSEADFGDVELETVYEDRYVIIYTDGNYYYMADYHEGACTVANIK